MSQIGGVGAACPRKARTSSLEGASVMEPRLAKPAEFEITFYKSLFQ
jgi:hypothetical protein